MFFLMFVKREFIITNEVSDQLVHEEQTDQKLFFLWEQIIYPKKNTHKKRNIFITRIRLVISLIGMTGLPDSLLALSHLYLHCLSKLVSVY